MNQHNMGKIRIKLDNSGNVGINLDKLGYIGIDLGRYGLGIDRYGSSRYRYRYMFPADISADTDTDLLGQRYRPPILIPIFSLSRYFADNRTKGRYKPIFWPISRIFNRYFADIYLADTDTDMPIPISSLPIPISGLPIPIYRYRYRYRYRPNISANRYIGLSLIWIILDGCG
jgi:hypothetical protein